MKAEPFLLGRVIRRAKSAIGALLIGFKSKFLAKKANLLGLARQLRLVFGCQLTTVKSMAI